MLLNILIALYNSAYEDISGNATDEYMAIFAQKTMQFVRAPDENVFIPRTFYLPFRSNPHHSRLTIYISAFNLIEILFVSAPFEWWLSRRSYARLNDVVMGVIYSPLLVLTAWLETVQADRIRWNRRHGEEDEDNRQEWDHVAQDVDFDLDDTWKEDVKQTTPDIKLDSCTLEIQQLKVQVTALTEMVKKLTRETDELANA